MKKLLNQLSDKVYVKIKKSMPPISDTEREAIESGDVWIEGDIFKGDINWKDLYQMKKTFLTEEENKFIEEKVKPLILKIDNYKINENEDLPQEIWNYLKEERFFSMIIPKEYGGLEFSPYGNSTVVAMLASVSSALAVTVMVPNSLGPAELLMKYGTEEQKNKWLNRLATGKEIPCFGLTSPKAGSDAGSIPDTGIVVKKYIDGKEVIGINLNFEKRYITLAPVATLLGLAFKLYDPNKLIGEKESYGITCALIPMDTQGIDNSYKHKPMNLGFMNGALFGKDVFIPLDYIIGGVKNAGKGWRMLVECLSAGRGISLPALSGAISQSCYKMSGAYSLLREQFNTPIYKFEGVAESLANIARNTYIIESVRYMTNTGLNMGRHPAVVTAITKYHTTELARDSIKESMDILGGKAIIQGRKNFMSDAYNGIPVAITVEGANILTKYLMIFGQGSLRCHPFLFSEMEAVNHVNEEQGKKEFNQLFFKHIKYSLKNGLSSFIQGLTFELISETDKFKNKKYVKRINHMSKTLASISDITLLHLGGGLKYKEFLSSRLGDLLSYMYMSLAVLKYSHDNDTVTDHLYAENALEWLSFKMGESFQEFTQNYPSKFLGIFMKFYNYPFGVFYKKPKFSNSNKLVKEMIFNREFRNNLCSESLTIGEFNPKNIVEQAYNEYFNINHEKINDFNKNNKNLISNLNDFERINIYFEYNLITKEEKEILQNFYDKVYKVIEVDIFKK